jgi:hypothetical protein
MAVTVKCGPIKGWGSRGRENLYWPFCCNSLFSALRSNFNLEFASKGVLSAQDIAGYEEFTI